MLMKNPKGNQLRHRHTTMEVIKTASTKNKTNSEYNNIPTSDNNDGGNNIEMNNDSLRPDADKLTILQNFELDVDVDTDYDDPNHTKYVWLHAFYHSVVVCIGTGILGLAHATAYLGYIGMAFLMTFVAICSYYTANLLIVCQTSSSEGTYSEVAETIMGKRFAIWCVRPFQFLAFFCFQPTFIVVGSQSMVALDGLDGTQILPGNIWSITMGLIIFVLSLVPDLSKAWQISLFGFIAAIMIAFYSILGSGIAVAMNNTTENEDIINFGRPSKVGDSTIGYTMGVLSSFGSIIFAYGYHVIMPDIQASLHDHNTKDANKDMKKATTTAYILAYPAYLLSALIGYTAFGSDVEGDVLLSLNNVLPKAAMYVIFCFVIIKVATEASVLNQGAFTLIRDIVGLTIEDDHVDHHPRNKGMDYTIRTIWVLIGTIIAIYVPIFEDLSVIGAAVAITPLSFIIPIILWNTKNKETVSTRVLLFHYMFMLLYFFFAIMALTGAFYDLSELSIHQ